MDLSFLRDSGGLFLPKPLQDFLGTYVVGDDASTFLFNTLVWSPFRLRTRRGTISLNSNQESASTRSDLRVYSS